MLPKLMYSLVSANTGEITYSNEYPVYVAEQWERKDKPAHWQIHVYDGLIPVLIIHESLAGRFLESLLVER